MKSVFTEGDWVNLPAGRRPNWSYRAKALSPSGAAAIARLRVLTQSEGLTGPDLLSAFVARRVLLLQSRPHMICQMSGHWAQAGYAPRRCLTQR